VIEGANSIALAAGRDLSIASTTRDTTSSQGKQHSQHSDQVFPFA